MNIKGGPEEIRKYLSTLSGAEQANWLFYNKDLVELLWIDRFWRFNKNDHGSWDHIGIGINVFGNPDEREEQVIELAKKILKNEPKYVLSIRWYWFDGKNPVPDEDKHILTREEIE